MLLPGELIYHESTVRANTRITAEIGCGGPYFVRIRTADAVTFSEPAWNETRARKRFEEVVVNHENGDAQ